MARVSLARNRVKTGRYITNLEIFTHNQLPRGSRFCEHSYDRNNRTSGQVITSRNGNFVFISDDLGENWNSTEFDEFFAVSNTFITKSNKMLVLGRDSKDSTKFRISVFGENKILSSCIVGNFGWHGTFSIDEGDGCIMYAEYPANKSTDKNKFNSRVLRSTDDGASWESVFEMAYPEIRHFHTCTAVPNRESHWIVTSGDTPAQSRFWISEDDGDNWREVSEKDPIPYLGNLTQRKSIHRTVVMSFQDESMIWATDDILGEPSKYGEEGSEVSSKLVKSEFPDDTVISEIVCSLGMHTRSMVDVGKAWLFISEAKYLEKVSGPEVFVVFKENPGESYSIMEIENVKARPTGGTYSKSSISSKNGIFFTDMGDGLFSSEYRGVLEWKISFEEE